MKRVREAEVMDDISQARAYAAADFSEENQWFVNHFQTIFPELTEGRILDVGCGPGDIPIRLARALPGVHILGVDASQPMIDLASAAVSQSGLEERIFLRCLRFQDLTLDGPVDSVISNSLVHHIPNPLQFWYGIKKFAKPGSPALIMDLLRPSTTEEARSIVDRYAAEESEQLRTDFYNSLLSAFTEDEVAAQLAEMNLSRLFIDVPDDRHWIVYGNVY